MLVSREGLEESGARESAVHRLISRRDHGWRTGFFHPDLPRVPAMRFSRMRGLIDRRILVNFRVDPRVLAGLLPAPFRPKLVHGCGMAGVCLIRLKHVRPDPLPRFLGLASENAAHRIAVEWEHEGIRREGVFVPRRDTSSRISVALAGRLFSGVQHPARFRVEEGDGGYRIDARERRPPDAAGPGRAGGLGLGPRVDLPLARGGVLLLRKGGRWATRRRRSRGGSTGSSCSAAIGGCEPLAVERVASSYFDDRGRFPAGTLEPDLPLLMREVEHEWVDRGRAAVPVRRRAGIPAAEDVDGPRRHLAPRLPEGRGAGRRVGRAGHPRDRPPGPSSVTCSVSGSRRRPPAAPWPGGPCSGG